MAPQRALRFCSLAAAAAASGAWPAADELAMVQSTVELTVAHQLQLEGAQAPGALVPIISMPSPNVSMRGLWPSLGNMTPVIDAIHQIDDSMSLWRNETTVGLIEKWGRDVYDGVMQNLKELEEGVEEISRDSASSPAEAGMKAAKILLLYEEKELYTSNITKALAAPVNRAINSSVDIQRLLEIDSWENHLRHMFNHSTEALAHIDAHANGSMAEMTSADCEDFRQLLTLMSWTHTHMEGAINVTRKMFNNSDEDLLKNPVVLIAADIMPELQSWAQEVGDVSVKLGIGHIRASEAATRATLRLVNDVALCGLDEESILRGSATASRPLGFSLLLAALAAAFAWAGAGH